MRSCFVSAIAIAILTPATLWARSDDIQNLDVRRVCRGIASQSGLEVGLQRTNSEQCVQSEQAVREELKKEWPTFSAAGKQHCVSLAKTGGESSYTELLTCLEMARDVRAMRAEASSSRAGATRAPSSPSKPTVQPAPAVAAAPRAAATRAPSSPKMPIEQPAPAEPASRPTSANEPLKLEDDSTLKEKLERAKAEAQNVTASEASAQRKLADVEAALQQTKKEAERATNLARGCEGGSCSTTHSPLPHTETFADVRALVENICRQKYRSKLPRVSSPGCWTQ